MYGMKLRLMQLAFIQAVVLHHYPPVVQVLFGVLTSELFFHKLLWLPTGVGWKVCPTAAEVLQIFSWLPL